MQVPPIIIIDASEGICRPVLHSYIDFQYTRSSLFSLDKIFQKAVDSAPLA